MTNDRQGRHNPASRPADQARLAAIARIMAIGAAIALLLLFALGHAHAATQAGTCAAGWSAITAGEWLITAFAAIWLTMLVAESCGAMDYVRRFFSTRADALTNARAGTSCPNLQAANAELAAQQRRRVRAGTSHPQA